MRRIVLQLIVSLLIVCGLTAQVPAAPTNVQIIIRNSNDPDNIQPPAATCTTTVSSGANLTTAITNIAAGGTLCLGAGSYTYSGSVSKSSMTTIRSTSGVMADVTFTSFTSNTSNNLTFQYVTFSGTTVIGTGDPSATGSTNLAVKNFNMSGSAGFCVEQGNSNANILIDHGKFSNSYNGNGSSGCTSEGRLGLKSSCTSCGITVSNSEFSGGASDGIQAHWGIDGVTIGPGNYFHDILEGGCGSVHCDSIQLFSASHITITGNFFYNNSDSIANFDCSAGEGATQITVTNNVMYQEPASATSNFSVAGGTGNVITHNTLGPNTDLEIGTWNDGCSNTGLTVRDNVFHGGCATNATSSTFDHNLVNGGGSCVGTGGISGSPTYTGGTTPTTWAGFLLTSLSSGHLAASDGLDMGATSFGP